MGTPNEEVFLIWPKILKADNKGIFNIPLFYPKLREKFQIPLYFHRKPFEVHQKLSYLGKFALVRDYHGQKVTFYMAEVYKISI